MGGVILRKPYQALASKVQGISSCIGLFIGVKFVNLSFLCYNDSEIRIDIGNPSKTRVFPCFELGSHTCVKTKMCVGFRLRVDKYGYNRANLQGGLFLIVLSYSTVFQVDVWNLFFVNTILG